MEWQPIESLSGTFKTIHKEIADVMYPDRTASFYRKNGLFVYFAVYKVPSREGAHGELEDLPVPTLRSFDWETPDACTISSFKAKIKDDILKAMTPGRISRRIRIQWFMPLHVFVACFKFADLQRTRTMWLNRRLPPNEVDTLLGEEWSLKETFHIGDTIQCRVSPNSLSISYQISRQSLVLGYDYRRWRKKLGDWVPLDSEENCPEIELEINVNPFNEPRRMIITTNWTLHDVRESLEFLDETTADYRFKVDDTIVSARVENTTFCATCLPPKIISFEPLTRMS